MRHHANRIREERLAFEDDGATRGGILLEGTVANDVRPELQELDEVGGGAMRLLDGYLVELAQEEPDPPQLRPEFVAVVGVDRWWSKWRRSGPERREWGVAPPTSGRDVGEQCGATSSCAGRPMRGLRASGSSAQHAPAEEVASEAARAAPAIAGAFAEVTHGGGLVGAPKCEPEIHNGVTLHGS
jgi:hypothetical protein